MIILIRCEKYNVIQIIRNMKDSRLEDLSPWCECKSSSHLQISNSDTTKSHSKIQAHHFMVIPRSMCKDASERI